MTSVLRTIQEQEQEQDKEQEEKRETESVKWGRLSSIYQGELLTKVEAKKTLWCGAGTSSIW